MREVGCKQFRALDCAYISNFGSQPSLLNLTTASGSPVLIPTLYVTLSNLDSTSASPLLHFLDFGIYLCFSTLSSRLAYRTPQLSSPVPPLSPSPNALTRHFYTTLHSSIKTYEIRWILLTSKTRSPQTITWPIPTKPIPPRATLTIKETIMYILIDLLLDFQTT
jgi:hypothetical protein